MVISLITVDPQEHEDLSELVASTFEELVTQRASNHDGMAIPCSPLMAQTSSTYSKLHHLISSLRHSLVLQSSLESRLCDSLTRARRLAEGLGSGSRSGSGSAEAQQQKGSSSINNGSSYCKIISPLTYRSHEQVTNNAAVTDRCNVDGAPPSRTHQQSEATEKLKARVVQLEGIVEKIQARRALSSGSLLVSASESSSSQKVLSDDASAAKEKGHGSSSDNDACISCESMPKEGGGVGDNIDSTIPTAGSFPLPKPMHQGSLAPPPPSALSEAQEEIHMLVQRNLTLERECLLVKESLNRAIAEAGGQVRL